ncbi:MAG: hypothetical protein KAR45_10135, partial [Desulfobacteraceae bacterium]|nr:hypothetical protein [Desulfobacteraceae bacterium]
MIKPIFFPFTHLQKTDIRAVAALFKSIFFFPASMPDEFDESIGYIEDKDFIIPIYPEKNDFEPVLHKVNEYRNWGELNKENKVNLKVLLQDKPYFTNDTSIPHLRANIERTPREGADLLSKKDTLLNNLMFLRLAKIHDLEKENLDNQFTGIEENEYKLFSAIRGDDSGDQESNLTDTIEKTPLKIRSDDFGEYMTSQRISAWVDFFNRKKPFNSFDSSLLFVTTSSAVMEYLLSISKNKIKLLDIDNLKVHEKKCENRNQWVETFNKHVENLVTSGQQSLNIPAERDDNCTLEIKIKLYLLQ